MWMVIAPLAVLAVMLAVLMRPDLPVQDGVAPGSSQAERQRAVGEGEDQR